MEEIEETDNYSILTDYDDGVVCFGTVTQSQIERFKRLPRHTVLPSDIESIRESIANSENVDEDDENDQSISTFDKSGKNSTIAADDSSINDITRITHFLDNEEATSTMKLKQSFPHDSSSNFSSPCRTKFIPTKNLIDTETINRYIRMESVSPNESFSENQNKSAIAKDETASYIDVEEVESSTNNFVHNETSSCRSSVSSVIERNLSKNHEIPDSDDNICTLKPCSQQDDEDISYCFDSEFEDSIEYSIVPDKYSITPGKQRLFDSRHAKSSIRAKTVSSAPFMDKIEETTTPLSKALNSSPMSTHNISCEPLENENNVERTSDKGLGRKSSGNYNPISSDWDSKSKMSADKIVEELSESTKFDHSVSENDSINYASSKKSATENLKSSLHDSVLEQTYENNLQNKSTLTNYKTSIDFNMPLKIVHETLTNTLNITTQIFSTDKSIISTSNIEVPMVDINDYNDDNVSEAVLTEIKSSNNSVIDTVINETINNETSTRLLLSNGNNKVLDKSYNGTRYAKYTSSITESSFDVEKSMINKSNIIISTVDINSCSNEEESEAMEVDIKSTNTSVVEHIVDETMSIGMLSAKDNSKGLNKSSNETNKALDTLNVAEQSFDVENSSSFISNVVIPNAEINSYNKEESEAMEVDIKSTNTSVVDNIFDETICTSMLFTNDKSKDLNKSSNEITQAEDTLNVAEQSFGNEKSINSISNVMETMADINGLNEVEEAVIKSSNNSNVANIFDETICTSMLFTNDKSQVMNKSSNETSEALNTLNVAEQSFGIQYSNSIISNIMIPNTEINNYNKDESKAMEVDFKSTNTSVVNNIVNETMCTSMLFTNDKSKDLNKSSNEITQAEDTLNVAEQSFGNEKSINSISNVMETMADINRLNEVEEAVIKSSNNSNVANIFDETICTSMLFTNDKSQVLNKSLNETSKAEDTLNVAEQSFGIEKSISSIPNTMETTADINGLNEVKEEVIKSSYDSIVTNVFDETICTSMLFTYDKSQVLNKSLNEISKAEDTSNVAEQSFDIEKCVNVLPNIIVPMTDTNNFYNEEESDAKDANIKSTNTSIVDNVVDETISTSMLSTNDTSKDLNKLSTETSPTKDSLNVTKQSYYDEKSLNKMIVSPLNANDASLISNFKENTLKYSSDIEIPCSEKEDNVFSNEISGTNENIPRDPLHGRKYLEFEQTIYNMCNDISSDTNQNKSNNYSDQTLENISMIEQMLCSDVSMKDDDNFSSTDNSLRSKLSVIIENRTLEENCNDTMEQNEHFKSPINDLKTTSILINNVNEIQDNVKLNESTNQDQVESELNKTDNKLEINTKSNISTTYDITLDEDLDKTKHNISSMLNDELSKTKSCTSAEIGDGFLNDKSAEEHFSTSKDIDEICSNQNVLINSNLLQPLIPENMNSNPYVIAVKRAQNLANVTNPNFEQNKFFNSDVQQPDLLSASTNVYDNSLDEYNKLEEMFYLEENKKLPTFDYKTPKVQKLLDFSIMQQSSTSTMLKQKLLNFSIVDQTPNRKSMQPINTDEKVIGNKDTLIDFSVAGQMLDLDVTLPDKMNFENSSNDFLLKNISKISAPDVELLVDESIIANSCLNDLSLNQTITDSTIRNLSMYNGEINKSQDYVDEKNSEETNVKSSDNEYCSMLSINEQFKTNKPSSYFDKTIEKVNLELSYNSESKQNKSCNKLFESKTTIEASICSSNINLNQSFKKPDSTNYVMDPNQLPAFNSNSYAIKDFSIVEEKTLQLPGSNENINNTFVGSDLNVSNLIEMSVIPDIDVKSNNQAVVSSDNPVVVVTSDEKSINSSSDDINNTAIHIEEHVFSHNPEFLTDIQMNDVSLLESSEKSSVGESFHSIELDQLQEDNKRKSEPDQEYHSHEKKIKVATEEPSTPMSMLYKLRNMFKSSEKPQNIKSNKENDSKSASCCQELNFSGVEQNKNKSLCYKKPEVLIKSKIPCKISDKSMSSNSEFNNSSLSLNESIKPKKGIPRFIGAPVLSDVSNSSNRKCTESRIPSKFKK